MSVRCIFKCDHNKSMDTVCGKYNGFIINLGHAVCCKSTNSLVQPCSKCYRKLMEECLKELNNIHFNIPQNLSPIEQITTIKTELDKQVRLILIKYGITDEDFSMEAFSQYVTSEEKLSPDFEGKIKFMYRFFLRGKQ